jgi:hypothetical protein
MYHCFDAPGVLDSSFFSKSFENPSEWEWFVFGGTLAAAEAGFGIGAFGIGPAVFMRKEVSALYTEPNVQDRCFVRSCMCMILRT